MSFVTGQILNNRYRIVKHVAKGGFGAVYRAWDMNLKVPCAIKENLNTQDALQTQFMREASILATLRHPHLPRVTDFFAVPEMGQYLVMDFIEGKDLQEMLDEAQGPLEVDQMLPWILQICDALNYLHSQNPPIIHRDIKPANIKINAQGQAVLVDFGIAKIFKPKTYTDFGARAVTPGFSPPEQYGQGSTDTQSDVYALGATLFALLTGQAPPDSVDLLARGATTSPDVQAFNPAAPAQLSAAVKRAMQMDKKARFGSIQEFKTALLQAAPQVASYEALITPVDAVEAGGTPTAQGRAKSFKVWIGVAAVAALLVLALIAGGVVVGGRYLLNAYQTTYATQTKVAQLMAHSTEVTPTTVATVSYNFSATPPPSPTATIEPTAPLSPTPSPGIGSTRVSEIDGMTLVYVPEGAFQMGAKGTDKRALKNEMPLHEVSLDAFWIDQTEVTNAMYARCVKAGACRLPRKLVSATREKYYEDGAFADYPVVYVGWEDAEDYCTWAGRRMPSEAEWEKAARGSDGRTYPWGEELNCNQANYWGLNLWDSWNEKGEDPVGCGSGTARVGSYPEGASPYNALDMAGNAGEWVADWYSSDYYANSPAGNPPGPVSGAFRVVRGILGYYQQNDVQWIRHGGHLYNFEGFTFDLRITYRAILSPTIRHYDVGFRCAMSP